MACPQLTYLSKGQYELSQSKRGGSNPKRSTPFLGLMCGRSVRLKLSRTLILVFFLFSVGCTTKPPIIEFTIARSAVESAKNVSAARYAPALWHKAEQSYRKGEEFFREEQYKKAAEAFLKARLFAERAENIARLEKLKNGEF